MWLGYFARLKPPSERWFYFGVTLSILTFCALCALPPHCVEDQPCDAPQKNNDERGLNEKSSQRAPLVAVAIMHVGKMTVSRCADHIIEMKSVHSTTTVNTSSVVMFAITVDMSVLHVLSDRNGTPQPPRCQHFSQR
jgi:hypothetical protein